MPQQKKISTANLVDEVAHDQAFRTVKAMVAVGAKAAAGSHCPGLPPGLKCKNDDKVKNQPFLVFVMHSLQYAFYEEGSYSSIQNLAIKLPMPSVTRDGFY